MTPTSVYSQNANNSQNEILSGCCNFVKGKWKRLLSINEFETEQAYNLRGTRSLFLFGTHENKVNRCFWNSRVQLRNFLHSVLYSIYFQIFIGTVIFLGAVDVVIDSSRNEASEFDSISERLFFTVFALEFSIRLVVNGFYWNGPLSTMKDPWSYVDLLCMISMALSISGENLGWMRGLRVFRIIKWFQYFNSARALIESVLQVIPLVLPILYIFFLLLSTFSLLFVELFQGKISGRCQTNLDKFCAVNSTCDDNSPCIDTTGLFADYHYRFDNAFISLAAVLILWSLNSWTRIFFALIDVVGPWTSWLLVFVITIGAIVKYCLTSVFVVTLRQLKRSRQEEEDLTALTQSIIERGESNLSQYVKYFRTSTRSTLTDKHRALKIINQGVMAIQEKKSNRRSAQLNVFQILSNEHNSISNLMLSLESQNKSGFNQIHQLRNESRKLKQELERKISLQNLQTTEAEELKSSTPTPVIPLPAAASLMNIQEFLSYMDESNSEDFRVNSIEEWKRILTKFDEMRDGTISMLRLRKVLRAFHVEVDPETLENVAKRSPLPPVGSCESKYSGRLYMKCSFDSGIPAVKRCFYVHQAHCILQFFQIEYDGQDPQKLLYLTMATEVTPIADSDRTFYLEHDQLLPNTESYSGSNFPRLPAVVVIECLSAAEKTVWLNVLSHAIKKKNSARIATRLCRDFGLQVVFYCCCCCCCCCCLCFLYC
jgi:hypothetical protein